MSRVVGISCFSSLVKGVLRKSHARTDPINVQKLSVLDLIIGHAPIDAQKVPFSNQ